MEVYASSVNELFTETLWKFRSAKKQVEETRNGKAYVLEEPLVICNDNPLDRVLYHRTRNANPFFQLMECIWMFAGANNDWIVQFNKNMESFMDYGVFHGAYGHRWREHFGFDQVEHVIRELRQTPNTRRTYIALWNPTCDLGQNYKDLPCNVGMTFQVRNGKLNGYIFNRSNDIIWGMLGTNCVHFSMLLEVIASCAGIPVGRLFQMTANAHIYERHWHLLQSPYAPDQMIWTPNYPLNVKDYQAWVRDCHWFIEKGWIQIKHQFFHDVVIPMYDAFINRNHGALSEVKALDWRKAGELWVEINRAA